MAEDTETKHGGHKNGKKGGLSGSSFFTWFMVIALLGVWTSVAVVWFDLVDYEEVLGKLGVYDADGDGDFDVDDAKVLLGLKERSASEPALPPAEAEPHGELEEQAPVETEPLNIEDEIKEQIEFLLYETVHTEHGEDLQQEADVATEDPQEEDGSLLTATDIDDRFETLEAGTFHEEAEDDYHVEETVPQDMEEMMYDQENPEHSEPVESVVDDDRLYQDTDGITYQEDTEPVYEPSESEGIEISDNVENSNIVSEEVSVPPVEEQQEVPPDT